MCGGQRRYPEGDGQVKGQVAREIRGIWNGEKGGQSQTVSNDPSIPWSKKVIGMNYAIQDVMTNGYDKKSVLTAI